MRKIEIEVNTIPEKTMYLTQHFGDGTLGKTKFDASFTIPTMSLIGSVGKKRYIISSQDIISEVITLHEENEK